RRRGGPPASPDDAAPTPAGRSSTPCSTWPARAAPGGCCLTTSRPGAWSATTSTPGGTRASSRRSTTSCGSTSAASRAKRTPPAGPSSTARPSRPPRPAAPRATTRGKKIAGRKRHLLVDTLGLIWGLAVLPADVQDFDGAKEVFRRVGGGLPRLAKVWADAIYRAFSSWVSSNCSWVLEVVTKRPGQTTFEVQPMRWIVERTFGWFGRYRRLSK